jgi:hypothetical protein
MQLWLQFLVCTGYSRWYRRTIDFIVAISSHAGTTIPVASTASSLTQRVGSSGPVEYTVGTDLGPGVVLFALYFLVQFGFWGGPKDCSSNGTHLPCTI